MKKPEIWKLVLGRLLPAKSDFSYNDWRTYTNRYLIPEIHTEILRFYGDNSSPEALHPGLDYANPAQRARLQAFPRHNQLFGVFERLRLVDSEIHALCKWEGTKYHKENFERQTRMPLRDTTWDDIQPYNKERPTASLGPRGSCPRSLGQMRAEVALGMDVQDGYEDEDMGDSEENEEEEDAEESEEESEDELQQSVGVELNQRLMAATEARARGEDATLDADWEQWMKEAMERGVVPDPSHTQALQTFARLNSESQVQVQQGSTSSNNGDHTLVAQRYSDFQNGSAFPMLHATQPPSSTPSRTPMYWGREIPEIFSDSPRPHVAALQAQLPPPPQYYPSAQLVQIPATGAVRSAPSTSVPS